MAWHGIDVAHATPEFCSLSEQPGWFLQFVWATGLIFAVCLSNRAEFCSFSTKFEEVQYNIVMIGSKDEEIFFSFLTITEETTH